VGASGAPPGNTGHALIKNGGNLYVSLKNDSSYLIVMHRLSSDIQ